MLVKPKSWERYGLKPWIEAAKRRLHHNVLAIALANKLARIAWAVLNRSATSNASRQVRWRPDPLERGTVLGIVKAYVNYATTERPNFPSKLAPAKIS